MDTENTAAPGGKHDDETSAAEPATDVLDDVLQVADTFEAQPAQITKEQVLEIEQAFSQNEP
jgi:hypothetical protein